jgi:Ca2+-binding EF-hand superfamily protein
LAEIQLRGIINDPELVLPHLMNDKTALSLDEVASRLHTQPWLINKILCVLGITRTDFLRAPDVQILTRVLMGSFDARALLFFDMIDIDGDRQVTREELIQFFTHYLEGFSSLKILNEAEDGERRQTILRILLEKFHLQQATFINFDQFYELVVNDPLLIETLSRFTVHPNW